MFAVVLSHAMLGCALVSDADLAARLDLDGDGMPRPGDCDDADASVGAEVPLFADADGDGIGSDASAAACQSSTGFVRAAGDCDDTRSDVYPEAEEFCDGVDNDCDGSVDENGGATVPTWYLDADGDLYGAAEAPIESCTQPVGYAAVAGDCDDADATANPGVREVCDGRDEDCSGVADDPRWWLDADADGYGRSDDEVVACDPVNGRADTSGDCDDGDPSVHPGATERCDPADIDEECDGLADDADEDAEGARPAYIDDDGDGHGNPAASVPAACELASGYSWLDDDCDDTRADVSPSATEVCYDGVDQNCDAANDDDCDLDGSPRDEDCDDANRFVSPLMIEACGDDVDNDCDGVKAGDCRLTGELSMDTADATISGRQPQDYAGTAADGVGDLNADGYDDLVIGSYVADDFAGTISIFHGPLTGDHSWNDDGDLVRGCSGSDVAGRALARGGDLDGDGLDDWVAGAQGMDVWGLDEYDGVAYLLGDGPASLCGSTRHVYGEVGDYLGAAVDAGADFTGDGADDLITTQLGHFRYDEFSAVTVYGSATVTAGPITEVVSAAETAALVVENDVTLAPFGYFVKFVGDLDGDGANELALGHDAATVVTPRDGAVYVVAGGTTGLVGTSAADAVVHGPDSTHRAEHGFAAGDIDGDGRDDLGVASSWWNVGDGAVFMFTTLPTGISSLVDADASVENLGVSTYLGGTADGAGDANGDGRNDLLLLSTGDERTGAGNGAALLYFGPLAGAYDETDADCVLYDSVTSFGTAIQGAAAFAGDTNGDGIDDLLISDAADDYSAPAGGVTWLFLGG